MKEKKKIQTSAHIKKDENVFIDAKLGLCAYFCFVLDKLLFFVVE